MHGHPDVYREKKREMLAASKVKISGSEKKVTSNTYDTSPP